MIEDAEEAVLLMLCSYWFFDICFPKALVKFLSFLAYLPGISCDTAKSVTAQSFINQL